MKPYILRQAWFIENFKKRLGEIIDFLLKHQFQPETVRLALQPAWDALKRYESTGEVINEQDIMKKITQGIVHFGKQQKVNFDMIRQIPHIDSKYYGSLLAGLDKPEDIAKDAPIPKITKKRKQVVKDVQQEIEQEKKREEEAAKDYSEAMRTKVIKDLNKQLFKEQFFHINTEISKFMHRKGK